MLTYQGELNERKSRADVAKAELDLANSGYQKEKDVLDGMMNSFQQAEKGIETHKK